MKNLYGASRLGTLLPNADRGTITGIEDIFTHTIEKTPNSIAHLSKVQIKSVRNLLPDAPVG